MLSMAFFQELVLQLCFGLFALFPYLIMATLLALSLHNQGVI